jgi:Domain of unknown function (DUF5615)
VKFLVDECLSPGLVALARKRGHGESTHVTWLGLRSRKDWAIVRRAFHAEIILELFNEYECFRKVSERTSILLSGSSPEHLEAISRHLPKELVHVLPRRQLRAA